MISKVLHRQLACLAFLALLVFPTVILAQGTNYARESDIGIDWIKRGVSIARYWNEAAMFSIRRDLARPVIHARNLFHLSVIMWNAWAAYEPAARQYQINLRADTVGWTPEELAAARNISISFGAYTLLKARYANIPEQNRAMVLREIDDRFAALGYNATWQITDDNAEDPRSIGLKIAQTLLNAAVNDGSYEQNDYVDPGWMARNSPIAPTIYNSIEFIRNPNYWQSIALGTFQDQNGITMKDSPPFTGPHWGRLPPFSLDPAFDLAPSKPGVWFDPGPPPMVPWGVDGRNGEDKTANPMPQAGLWYQGNHSFVAEASSWLDPDDNVTMDISPASIGNNTLGKNDGMGHAINPKTGKPYERQVVKRGDYYRVLAEFWADGPFSEAPPGHWNVILNYVSYHPEFTRKFQGKGRVLDPLEWDVKAYLAMNGAMHDTAIAAWGIKGYYESARPITAIRFMGWKGQSEDPDGKNYNKYGWKLKPGLVEMVTYATTAPGGRHAHLQGREGEIAIWAWRGPSYINATSKGYAGVGWILARDWWPYQRPNFVTPPFAGYVSGHSSYSRAAAEIMTLLTGDEYFPGGMSHFLAPKNEFLVFEKGPSMDIDLQWATYYDAADECAISRIWGGIHPRMDDIPGRIIGAKVGKKAFAKAVTYFNTDSSIQKNVVMEVLVLIFMFLLAIVGTTYVLYKLRPQFAATTVDIIRELRRRVLRQGDHPREIQPEDLTFSSNLAELEAQQADEAARRAAAARRASRASRQSFQRERLPDGESPSHAPLVTPPSPTKSRNAQTQPQPQQGTVSLDDVEFL